MQMLMVLSESRVPPRLFLSEHARCLAIGLQYKFKSFMWVTTVPPILLVIAFKVWLNKTFYEKYIYYVPSETELREAKILSSQADDSRNRLEKRFGHPALHAELFTPILHAKMMDLLPEVYKGKISSGQAQLDEYGGQKMDARVVAGGLRIAGVEQRDLEYDPALYRRDRGELDWDARSIASNAIFGHNRGDSASVYHQKTHYYAGSIAGGRASPAPSAFDRYTKTPMNRGSVSAIELSRLGSVDHLPLLNDPGYSPGDVASQSSPTVPLPQYASPEPMLRPPSRYGSPVPQGQVPSRFPSPAQVQYPPQAGMQYSPVEGYREAPLHRPYPSRDMSMGHGSQESISNMAGRGVYRGGGAY